MRRLCRAFAFFFPILLLAVGLFLFDSTATRAQGTTQVDKVGTHLIQGDEGAQKKVLDKLTSSGLKSPTYPVVVMVYPNGSGVSLLSSGYLAIARINIDCNTSTQDMTTLAGAIPAGTPVTIGNEINNQNPVNGEWKNCDYTKYAQLFNTFASAWNGKGPLGISTMDTINDDYDAATTLNQIFSSGINKAAISAVFANVYQTGGCGAYEATRCTVNSGQWVLSKINSLAGRNLSTAQLYITEFGITTCKDFDCVQDFYVQNNDQPAVAKVGFLRNPTSPDPGNSDWYHTVPAICEYWHQGDLAVEKPEKCGGGKRQVFVYPGIEDMAPDVDKMRQMAAGYTLTCGNQFKIKGDISNESALNNRPPGYEIDCSGNPPDGRCTIPGVWANVIIDSTKAVIPLFRFQGAQVPNPDQPKRRLDDLEGFFSANYTKEELVGAANTLSSSLITPLANGVSRKVIGTQEQCQATITYLQTIKQLCDTENNRSGYTYNDKLDADALKAAANIPATPKPTPIPGECALYSQIPGADARYDTYKKVLEQMPQSFSCRNVDTLTQNEMAWYRSFSKVELTTPKGFKPAYLVHYVDRPETPQTNLDKRVVWLAPGEDANGGIGDPRNLTDRIKVVKVYVPAGFAEVNINAVNNNPDLEPKEKQPTFFPTYTGGFMQTITSIMPMSVQTQIAKTRALVIDKLIKAMPNATSGLGIKCESCSILESNPEYLPRVTIVRRINAEFATSGQDACTHDDLVGETATERVHTINPAGTLDPVKLAKIPVTATLVATKPGSDNRTIKTFLLLPEEYRNITDYETPFLQTFLPYDYQDITKHPEFNFITYESERAANPKAAYKYLQITGSSTSIINPKFDGADLSYTIPDPNAPPVVLPDGTVTQGTKTVDGKLSGQLNLEKTVTVDPQVPGGKIARALWEVVCNVTRPYNGKATIQYPGFEKFLQQGLAACTQGAVGTPSSPGAPVASLCSGTTILPAHADGDWGPLKALVAQAAQSVGIPANYLWGVLQIEGGSTLRAYRNNQTTVACTANSVGAVGAMQVLVKACGAPYDNWGTYSPQAGVAGSTPCDLLASLKVGAQMLKFNYAAQAHPNCSPNYPNASAEEKKWMNAAGAYYGSCEILNASANCTNASGVNLTYGECAIELYAPTY